MQGAHGQVVQQAGGQRRRQRAQRSQARLRVVVGHRDGYHRCHGGGARSAAFSQRVKLVFGGCRQGYVGGACQISAVLDQRVGVGLAHVEGKTGPHAQVAGPRLLAGGFDRAFDEVLCRQHHIAAASDGHLSAGTDDGRRVADHHAQCQRTGHAGGAAAGAGHGRHAETVEFAAVDEAVPRVTACAREVHQPSGTARHRVLDRGAVELDGAVFLHRDVVGLAVD